MLKSSYSDNKNSNTQDITQQKKEDNLRHPLFTKQYSV